MGSQPHSGSGRDPDLLVTSVRIHREKMERFKRVAAANQRTVSQQMRWLIDRNIEEHDEEQVAA